MVLTMPTYEYKCDACGEQFERFQSITAAPVEKCPACRKKKVRRLISTGAGLIFKGSGFYITDYRSESYKSAAKADSPGGSSGDSKNGAAGAPKESSKTATKSAATAPAKKS